MDKLKIRIIDLIYCLAIIGADIFVYMILGVLQMDYDDNYHTSKGENVSLSSMNKWQLLFYILLQLWNLLNILGILYIGHKIFKRLKNGT